MSAQTEGAATLLNDLRARGVAVALDGEQIRLRGSKKVLTPALAEQIRQAKPALIRALSEPNEADRLESDRAERAAIMEIEAGLPREIATGLASLDTMKCPAAIPPSRWQSVVNAACQFTDRWASEAVKHGWPLLDLFGVDPDQPWTRIDRLGVIFLVAGQREVTGIDADRITMRTVGGAIQTYHRRDRGPRVFVWDLDQGEAG